MRRVHQAAVKCVLGLLLCLTTAARAQVPSGGSGSFDLSSIALSTVHGICELDGELLGIGPSYRARFLDGGLEFTPYLGRRAPEAMPWALRLESIRRGQDPGLEILSRAWPRRDGDLVVYDRGGGVQEWYEVRTEGVEQFFRIARKPAGSGDLILRQRLATMLPLSSESAPDGRLRFVLPGVGGVECGAVFAFDQRGRSIQGQLRCEEGCLDLIIPEEFVESATFPLVIDPLIGTTVQLSSNCTSVPPFYFCSGIGAGDVAYDASSGQYLVVWSVSTGLFTADLLGQRVTAGGTLIGSVIALDVGGTATAPSVANLNHLDCWMVAYEGGAVLSPSLSVRTVSLSLGVVSNATVVTSTAAPGGAVARFPRVGGDLRFNPLIPASVSKALVVWEHGTILGTSIRGRLIQAAPPGDPLLVGVELAISSGPSDSRPAITRDGGAAGEWLVAWQRVDPSASLNDPWARLVRSNGSLCSGEVALSTSPGVDETGLTCARKPLTNEFLVAYEWTLQGAVNTSIKCQEVTAGTTCSSSASLGAAPPVTVVNLAAQRAVEPALALTEYKYVLAYVAEDSGGFGEVRMKTLSPEGCIDCGPVLVLGSATEDCHTPAVAAQAGSSLAGGEEAFIVWGTDTPQSVRGRGYAALGSGGGTLPYASACGGGGTLSLGGPAALGNTDFSIDLTGGDPTATAALLVLSPNQLFLSCGPCTLVPALDGLLIETTPNGGSASVPIPIPCDQVLSGFHVYAQWILAGAASTPCALTPGVVLSNSLRIILAP